MKKQEHAIIVLEIDTEEKLQNFVKIDSMPFRFVARKSTTDRVPREVLFRVLRSLRVDKWIESVKREMSEDFHCRVGV